MKSSKDKEPSAITNPFGSTRRRSTLDSRKHSSHLPQALSNIRNHPEMYLILPSFNACASAIQGINAAWEGGLLFGFREWLTVKLDAELNAAWPEFIVQLARKSGSSPIIANERSIENVTYLLDTLDDFLAERSTDTGPRAIFLRYDDWLRTQEHYDEDSPIWVPRQEDLAKKSRPAKAPPRRSKTSRK